MFISAPVDDWNSNTELAFPDDGECGQGRGDRGSIVTVSLSGCYYQYKHYNEGEQIVTNEPCLNCTCHNQMLMCFLR